MEKLRIDFAERFSKAELQLFIDILLPISVMYEAVVSRASSARWNRYVAFPLDGRWTCLSSFSFVRFTQLKIVLQILTLV